MDVGIATGLERATGTMLQTGMRLKAMQPELEQAEREKIKFQTQQKNLAEQEARDNKVVEASSVFSRWNDFPGFQKLVKGTYEKHGLKYEIIDGKFYSTVKDGKFALSELGKEAEDAKNVAQVIFGDLSAQEANLKQQMQTLKKPEEIAGAQKNLKTIQDQLSSLVEVRWKLEGEKDKEEFAGTGGVVYSKKTGRPSYITPKVAAGDTPSEQTKLARVKALADAEANILEDPTAPTAAADAGRFNALSTTHEYVYGNVEVPGRVFGTNTKKGWYKVPKGQGVRSEPRPNVNIKQYRKWASEAIAAGRPKGEVSKQFKDETGEDY